VAVVIASDLSKDINGKPLPLIDGSAWDPFAKVLLLTSEEGKDGGVSEECQFRPHLRSFLSADWD